MVTSDATEKNCNTGAQLQSILHTTAQKKDFAKFTSRRTFGAHKLVHSEPFLEGMPEYRSIPQSTSVDDTNGIKYTGK